MFKEPVYQILEKIKNESYFKWPYKMGGDPSKRNQSLYCHYHQERGHTTEDCRTLHDHLGQLEKVGKLKQYLHQPTGQIGQARTRYQRDSASRPTLGTINLIFATPRNDMSSCLRIISVVLGPELRNQAPEYKGVKLGSSLTLGFSE